MKSFVVTGANQGIGLATVKRILHEVENSFVFLGSRSLENGNKAVEEILKEDAKLKDRVKVLQVDISKKDSIDSAKKTIEMELKKNSSLAPLFALVNNAGVLPEKDLKQGVDVNVYGTRNMTKAIIPLLDQKKGRVVIVSSIAGPNFLSVANPKYRKFFTGGETTWEELDAIMKKVVSEFDWDEKKFSPTMREMGIFHMFQYNEKFMAPYTFSKACENCLTLILAKEHPNLKINSCHPGPIWTSMTTHLNKGDEEIMRKKGLKSPKEGTVSTMHLLTAEHIKGNGNYYSPSGTIDPMVQNPAGATGLLLTALHGFRVITGQ